MTATPATSPFLGLIEPYEWNLLALARRQFLIEAFTGDLDRITRGKLFRFRNHSVWLMLLDTRDMLVIQLASLAKGVMDPGGLVNQLQQHHAADLPRTLPPAGPSRIDEPEWVTKSVRGRREREHAECFDRLFPAAVACPTGSDFEDLRQAIRGHIKPLKDDRNWNRAHPFEQVRV